MKPQSTSMGDLQNRIKGLLDLIHARVPDFPMGSIPEYVDVGEFKLALEDLTCNLHELGVVLTLDIRKELVEICRRSGVDESYWSDLVG